MPYPGPRAGVATWAVVAAMAAGGAFSYYQLGSGLFSCGRDLAGPEIRFWLGLAALQSLLFLAGSVFEGARRLYRWAQYLTIPLVAVALAQVALTYPRIFIWIALLAAGYWFVRCTPLWLGRRMVPVPGVGAVFVETTIFLMAALVVHTALAFVLLHMPGRVMTERLFSAIGLVSLAIAAFMVRRDAPLPRFSIGEVPPLALLVAVVLRAKFPDAAYDSLFYKATLPITIADWGTALTGVFDHTLLGTDFGEILASQLRALDPSYSPAMTSTLAFLAMWAIVPFAARGALRADPGRAGAVARAVLALLVVSLSEAHIAAGTAYHEPLMGLFMVGFLLPMALGWLFLSAAVATKLTVLFVAPVLLLAKLLPWRMPQGLFGAPRARVLAPVLCLAFAAFVQWQQFHRNLDYTGRVLGVAEIAVGVTDPRGEVMARVPPPMSPGLTAYDRYVGTFMHMLTLDRWIPAREDGFHVMPSSRVIPVAFVLLLVFLLVPSLRRERAGLAVLLLWSACAFVLMSLVNQGRHFHPLSFAAAVAIACAVHALLRSGPAGSPSTLAGWAIALAAGALAIGDQFVGSYINNGWICERSMMKPAVATNWDRPENEVERRLAQVVSEYRARSPARTGVIPSIVCENTTERKHYLGAHHVYAFTTVELTLRYVAADPARALIIPSAVLAVCFSDATFMEHVLPPAIRGEYTELPPAGPVRIMVSKRLMAGARPETLLGAHHDAAAAEARATTALFARWDTAKQPEGIAPDSPNGKGAFALDVDGQRVGVLLSPYRLTFEDVHFHAGGKLTAELAMLYPNTDGMAVEFVFEAANGARHVESVALKPAPQPRAWVSREIVLPVSLDGPGRITLVGASPSGDSNADWALVRKLDYRAARTSAPR